MNLFRLVVGECTLAKVIIALRALSHGEFCLLNYIM